MCTHIKEEGRDEERKGVRENEKRGWGRGKGGGGRKE